eukprot:748799-Hanusia_phi.AAC.1
MLLFLTACMVGYHICPAAMTPLRCGKGLNGRMGLASLRSSSISSSSEPLRIQSLLPPVPPVSLPPFIIHIRSDSSKAKLSEVISSLLICSSLKSLTQPDHHTGDRN